MGIVRFRSKVDLWIGALLAVLPGYVLVGASQAEPISGFISVALVGMVYVGLVFPIRYEFHADALVVRSGLLRYRRPYADIVAATPNRSPFSAPALSLDRLLIRSGGSMGLNISPEDRERFLATLVRYAPHLSRTQDGRGLYSR